MVMVMLVDDGGVHVIYDAGDVDDCVAGDDG